MDRPYRIEVEADAVDAQDLAFLLVDLANEIEAGKLGPRRVSGGASRSSIVRYWTPVQEHHVKRMRTPGARAMADGEYGEPCRGCGARWPEPHDWPECPGAAPKGYVVVNLADLLTSLGATVKSGGPIPDFAIERVEHAAQTKQRFDVRADEHKARSLPPGGPR